MHALILSGLSASDVEPVKTAEEVIREIDDIMQVRSRYNFLIQELLRNLYICTLIKHENI